MISLDTLTGKDTTLAIEDVLRGIIIMADISS